MTAVIASAAGKINLALLVGPPNADGYHPLSSVFEAVSLREYVVIREGVSGGGLSVRTLLYSQAPGTTDLVFDPSQTRAFSVHDGPNHLAVRAATLLARDGQALDITVHKALPVAGGMAGGSADAAATLVAMNQFNDLGHSNAHLAQIGASLGADVPACVVGGLALGLGRGDQMTPLQPGTDAPGPDSRWWVAAFATEGLSTPTVFRAFDAGLAGEAGADFGIGGQSRSAGLRDGAGADPGIGGQQRSAGLRDGAGADPGAPRSENTSVPGLSMDAELLSGLQSPGMQVGDWLVNGLEPTVFEMRPELREVGETMEGAGARAWLLSGSGPTIVGMVPTEDAAQALASKVHMLPQVRSTAVMWGPGRSAQVETVLPPWAVGEVP